MKIHPQQSSFRILLIISIALNLSNLVTPYTFSYTRVSNCILQTETGCVYWESTLEFEKKLDALCFPEETYLQGRQQKIKMSELKVGDEVLVYREDGVGFERVKAWLHRDVEETFLYNFVGYQIKENAESEKEFIVENGFHISGMHNIAIFSNKTNQIQYEFAQNLEQRSILFGHGPYSTSQTPIVSKIGKRQQMKGVYAPYTSVGNYFITSSKENDQLILVHSFAHVSTKYHFLFESMISWTPFWNVQPEESSYIHPLSKILKDFFPSVIQIKTLNHMASEISQKHNYLSSREGGQSGYRYETQNSERDFSQERKAMIIIDRVLSMVETFV